MASPDQAYVPNGLPGRLGGMRLFSVQFVLDYVQLRFDGPTPDMPVTARAGHFADGQPGYGDALRSLIPGVVARAQEATGLGLRIGRDTGSAVLHPPARDLAGPQIALLPASKTGSRGAGVQAGNPSKTPPQPWTLAPGDAMSWGLGAGLPWRHFGGGGNHEQGHRIHHHVG